MIAMVRSSWLRVLALLPGLLLFGVLPAPASATDSSGAIEICKTASGDGVSGSFQFTVSGVTGSVSVPVGQCSFSIPVKAGQVTVTEQARDGYVVSAIAALPSTAIVSTNLGNRTATVNVASGGVANETIVTFTNKLAPTGFLEVCKKAQDGTNLGGYFTFHIAASGTSTTATAPVGGCSLPVELPIGNATVTEDARSDAQFVSASTTPSDRLVSLSGVTATVKIVSGGIASETIVTFVNKPKPQPKGFLKVCKVAGAGVATGQAFTFTVDGTTVQVLAGSCSLPISAAAGTVNVTEAAATGYVVSAISADPAASLLSSSLSARTASVAVTSGQVVEVTFTNMKATGVLKICKVAGAGVVPGQSFTFTLAGQSYSVQAGFCSQPITLPVGNYAVDENVPSGYVVTSIVVTGAGSLVSSSNATGTAVVSVTPGTTEVTFTDKKATSVTGCVLTKGYYKNHPGVVSYLLKQTGGTLTVGGVSLTAGQIDNIYDRNARNFLNQVSQQLITALLNQLGGASTPASVQSAIDAAQLLIDQNGGPLTGSAKASTQVVLNGVTYTASQLVDILSNYNEGNSAGGPGHCGGGRR